jgi:hypothetical protein
MRAPSEGGGDDGVGPVRVGMALGSKYELFGKNVTIRVTTLTFIESIGAYNLQSRT